jgi:UDP-3-O-[3-hydroxymyristoyl] glucosamine N-acyltransferase
MGSTIIRKGCKIDNHCQIAHNVEVGKNTVMAAMCGIAGSTKIGEHCILGGQVGIAGHLTIADNTSFGAQSGMISNAKTPGMQFFGTPALPYMEYMRSYAAFKTAGKK